MKHIKNDEPTQIVEYSEATGLIDKARRVMKNHGLLSLPKYVLEYLYHNLEPRRKFDYESKLYTIYRSWTNPLSPWRGEREAELPIIIKILEENQGKEILEVGNVMKNYYDLPNYDVLDKYEKGKGIINADVATYKTKKKYDLIISVSTMEHVGYDEEPREKGKAMRGILNLLTMIKKGGELIFTIPIGHNKAFEKQLSEAWNPETTKTSFMQKEGKQWTEYPDKSFINEKKINFAIIKIKKK